MAASGRRQTAPVVRRWRREIDFGPDEIEELLTLLVGDPILAARALALVRAKEPGSQAVTVQLEAACAPTVAGLVRRRISHHEGLRDRNDRQVGTNLHVMVSVILSRQRQ